MQSARSSTSSAAGSPPAAPDQPGLARSTIVLGVGAFGLAWSLTTTAAYLPPKNGTDGSRPSIRVATRRLSELLKPRVLKL